MRVMYEFIKRNDKFNPAEIRNAKAEMLVTFDEHGLI